MDYRDSTMKLKKPWVVRESGPLTTAIGCASEGEAKNKDFKGWGKYYPSIELKEVGEVDPSFDIWEVRINKSPQARPSDPARENRRWYVLVERSGKFEAYGDPHLNRFAAAKAARLIELEHPCVLVAYRRVTDV